MCKFENNPVTPTLQTRMIVIVRKTFENLCAEQNLMKAWNHDYRLNMFSCFNFNFISHVFANEGKEASNSRVLLYF